MDIANQLQKIWLFITEYGSIAILKQMATPSMAAVVRNCVPGQKAAHDSGNGRIASPKEQMKVVWK